MFCAKKDRFIYIKRFRVGGICYHQVALHHIKIVKFHVNSFMFTDIPLTGSPKSPIMPRVLFRVLNISFYPAEMKLYGSADISSVTIVLKGGETDQSLDVKIYSAKDTFKEKKIEKAVFEYIKRNDFLVPLKTGIEAIPVMMKLEELPTTQAYCDNVGISFAREMDETRFKEKLLPEGNIRKLQ